MRVLIDTNVILDVWLAREPFVRESARLLSAAEKGTITAIVCPTTVTTLHYLVKREKGERKARSLLMDLMKICEVGSLQRSEIQHALRSKIRDFEDAVIEATASQAEADVIATRNVADFRMARIPAREPQEIRW